MSAKIDVTGQTIRGILVIEIVEKEISVEDMQKIVGANEKLVKGVFNAGVTTDKEDR